MTTGLIKISVSLFYLHIFSTQKYRRVIKPWVAIMIAWTLGFLVAHLALCGSHDTPASSTLQDPKIWNKYCGNGVAMGRWLVVSSAITDLVTVLLPLPMVSCFGSCVGAKHLTDRFRSCLYIYHCIRRSRLQQSSWLVFCKWNLNKVIGYRLCSEPDANLGLSEPARLVRTSILQSPSP